MNKIPEWAVEKIKEAKEKQLKGLDLSGYKGRRLIKVPPEVLELKQLEKLNLSDNELTTIPDAIGQLQNLTMLRLNENQLLIFK